MVTELEKEVNKTVVAYVVVLSLHLLNGTEENHEEPHCSQCSISLLIYHLPQRCYILLCVLHNLLIPSSHLKVILTV
jgi:hypothetical protein